jgi:CubicO group peptidase (beta-lactamase class C family)
MTDPAGIAARASGLAVNSTEIRLRFLMSQPLKDAPGSKEQYSNFDYDVLRLLIFRTTGRTAPDYVRHELCRPYGLPELKEIQAPGVEVRGEPPQVWNARSIDFDTYPIMPVSPLRASAPALCTCMSYFWPSGEPRDNGNWFWTMNGSSGNATAQMCWRVDEQFPEFDYAFIFNGRGEGAGHDQIQADLKQTFRTVLGVK